MTDEQIVNLAKQAWTDAGFVLTDDDHAYVLPFARALLAAGASAKLVNYEELEREHFGDAESGTGIYAPRPSIEASVADTEGAKAVTLSKDQIRAIFLGAGFTIKEGQGDLRPYVYDAAYCLLSAAAPASIADTAMVKRDAARYQIARSGKALTVRVPVKDKLVTYCLTHKPEEGYAEAFDAAVDAYLAATPASSVADAAGASEDAKEARYAWMLAMLRADGWTESAMDKEIAAIAKESGK